VTVAANGNIFVGCDGSDSVEIFDSKGNKVGSIANLAMPNDLALDRAGNLYVVDSKANAVVAYDTAGQWTRTIGLPLGAYTGLFFPSGVTVAYRPDATAPTGEVGEIYVADQNRAQIQVFDLQGNPLRVLAGPMSDFSSDWQGRFVRPQSVEMDSSGRLHVLDAYLGRVQILDPVTGVYLAAYAAFDAEAERLRVPLDLLLAADGRAVVTNSETRTLEVFATLPN